MPTITVERRLLKASVPVNTSKRHISSQLLLCCLCCKSSSKQKQCYYVETRGVLPYKRLMGMCRWMGSHFHDQGDYNGVAFSIELLEWGRKVPKCHIQSWLEVSLTLRRLTRNALGGKRGWCAPLGRGSAENTLKYVKISQEFRRFPKSVRTKSVNLWRNVPRN